MSWRWGRIRGSRTSGVVAELLNASAVDEGTRQSPRPRRHAKFAILPRQWTEEDGQLTPSLKLKRKVVIRESHDDVEALYRR